MNDSNPASDDQPSTSDEKAEDSRKPFVKPELRREADLVDSTRGTFSGLSTDPDGDS